MRVHTVLLLLSLYMLSNNILEISFAEMLSICKSEFLNISDLDVHTISCLVLNTNAIVLDLTSRFDKGIKLVKEECEVGFLLSFAIHSFRKELYLHCLLLNSSMNA